MAADDEELSPEEEFLYQMAVNQCECDYYTCYLAMIRDCGPGMDRRVDWVKVEGLVAGYKATQAGMETVNGN